MCTHTYAYVYEYIYMPKSQKQLTAMLAPPGQASTHHVCPQGRRGPVPATMALKHPLHLGESSRVAHLLHRILPSLDTKVSLAKG